MELLDTRQVAVHEVDQLARKHEAAFPNRDQSPLLSSHVTNKGTLMYVEILYVEMSSSCKSTYVGVTSYLR